MSAPPIGMIRRKPIANASSVIKRKLTGLPVAMKTTSRTTIRALTPMLIRWRWGKRIGALLISACSLANAITEPEKVIAPMITPSPISSRLATLMAPSGVVMWNSAGLASAAAATNTAAMPTRLWNAATSWGIAVIGMRSAIATPIAPPIATPIRIMK